MTKEKMTQSQWLETNCFSQDKVSYIVMGKSYPIKDNLKQAGFKFSPLLHWHGANSDLPLPNDCWYLEVEFDDFFVWNEEEGIAFLKEGAREALEQIFNPPRESKSEHVGEVGDKVENIHCEVSNIGGFNTPYGYKWVYTFIDDAENEYTWFTTVNKALSTGMFVDISGTVKEHSEYKGVKTTVLTRCKINNVF